MENQEILLDIRNLTVQFVTEDEVVHAVNNISLTIPKGRTLGLVGETGAGKTTTALTVLRLLPKFTGKVAGGEIYFDGELIRKDGRFVPEDLQGLNPEALK